MRTSTIVAGALFYLAFLPSSAFAQGDLFGQNLYLFSLNPHTDKPEINFSNNGYGTKIVSSLGRLSFLTDAGDTAFLIDREANQYGLSIGQKNEGVSIGWPHAESALAIYSTDNSGFADSKITCYDFHSPVELRTMLELNNNGPVRFEFHNEASNQTWAFQTNHSDGFLINRLGSGGNEFAIRKSGMVTMGPGGKLNFILDTAGNLQIDGTLTQSSDRHKKEAFAEVDSQEILNRVSRLPITEWRYKDDPAGIRHIGPVAQDFYREFQIGKDDKTIATVDADGVALAAIQALNTRLEALAEDVAEKNSQLLDARRRIEELESRISEMAEKPTTQPNR